VVAWGTRAKIEICDHDKRPDLRTPPSKTLVAGAGGRGSGATLTLTLALTLTLTLTLTLLVQILNPKP